MINRTFLYKIFAKLPALLLALLAAVALAACDSVEEPANPDQEQPSELARRTVLVYMAAANSLANNSWDYEASQQGDPYDVLDISEMQKAAVENGLNGCRVLIYRHTKRTAPYLCELTEEGELLTLKEYADEEEMAVDASRMSQVIADTKALAPARDYGLVLWSHASGWLAPTHEGNTTVARAFGIEDVKGKDYGMSIPTLANVLSGEEMSFVYFDCCNMASVEVAYELRHATPVIIASVAETPAPGMRYDLTLPQLVADQPDFAEVARLTFESYNTGNYNDWCTMTVVNTAALDELAAATRAVVEGATSLPTRSQLQMFMTGALYDLGEMVERASCDESLKDAWTKALDKVVIYQDATPYIYIQGRKVDVTRHCGLGTYVLDAPEDASIRGYNTLQWYKAIYEQ